MKKRFVLAVLMAGGVLLTGSSLTCAAEEGQPMEEVSADETGGAEDAVAETETELTYTPGGAVDTTKEDLVARAEEALQNVSNMKSELAMDMTVSINITGEESETGMQMDMIMNARMENEEIFEPYTAHRTETMFMSIMGQTDKQVSETYIREEDGKLVEYQGTAENGVVSDWMRSDSSAGEEKMIQDGLKSFGDPSMMELLDQKVVDNAGKEYYVLEGSISLDAEDSENEFQEEVKELLDGLESSFGEGSVELPDAVTMDLYIGAEDFLPAELLMDLSGIRSTMTDTGIDDASANMDMEFSTLTVRLRCSDYNAITEISFPDNLPVSEETEGAEPETEAPVSVSVEETEAPAEAEGAEGTGEDLKALAEELGVSGIQNTTDTSVAFTDKGAEENPAELNEMGKAYLYNSNSDQYEQIGVQVTAITGGDEAAQYVKELLNDEDGYYRFYALRDDEEYRVVNYDIYLPTDLTDSEYGIYSPACMFDVVGVDGDSLEYNGRSYYAAITPIYNDVEEYHPGDTAHCKSVIIMPKEAGSYALQFGPYGLDSLYVAIR